MSMICWFNFAPVAPIEFDLALDPRHVFRALSLPGAQRLELLVALLEILEFGGRDGRTNAEARRHSDLTRIGFGKRRGRAPKTPTLLDVLGVRGDQTFKITNALFRECWTRTYELQRHRHVSLGVAPCQSEILSLKKAVWRLWLVSKSRTKSSAEGCEQLLRRAASVARPPSSPSHARTALSRTICGRSDQAAIGPSRFSDCKKQ